ncbi:exopolysaccharide biosynthesis polyprenyl glycosylphosphotransferase [Enterovirga aerilata]|uniref:Exopolysaccharide biosynthesis polyprenyl glycosylphosphotransferase n=1 Tax=Enterovirga aerilata TaxID=2730920 RepID=A0A849I4G6_9HYPH|nr:exopolysaccharide biosynthesis polyprenyl glycosylphosphotransferase [Enterovirga sp. DB1703]NNM71269.1 exopolysaccharide biosynthesis polyprenyl glycosylphosphotransferase [Enterovirga sp. DB1703]
MSESLPRYPHHRVEISAAGLDFAIITLSGPVSAYLHGFFYAYPHHPDLYLGFAILVASVCSATLFYRGLYKVEHLLSLYDQIKYVVSHLFISIFMAYFIVRLIQSELRLFQGETVAFVCLCSVQLIGARAFWSRHLSSELDRGGLKRRPVALLTWSDDELAPSKKQALLRNGFEITETISLDRSNSQEIPVRVAKAIAQLRGSNVEEILIHLPYRHLHILPIIVFELRSTPLPASVLPDDAASYLLFQRRRGYGSFGLVEVKREPLTLVERSAKRILDLVVAGLAIAALAPLLLFVAAAVKFDSAGPILFRQTRRGFNGRSFKILKFRTMHVLEDGGEVVQATRSDRRVTRVGRWLRRTSIDELPQLWNVIKGDMSVIGPRPHAVAHDEIYSDVIDNYAHRQHVKPGLTGWAQVNGFRGETPRVEDMKARVDHDLWYIENWSLELDLRILALTCTKLISHRAY